MDIYGAALYDYFTKDNPDTLWLLNSYDEPEEMPVDVFFRSEDEMPDIELKALQLCRGRVLDVGAGVGSHTLILQQKGFNVAAIDISEKAVEIMKARGVQNASTQDLFLVRDKYDTLLFLMNGIGLTSTINGFTRFLTDAKLLLNPGGQLLFDSSDISYLYEDLPKPKNKYFGEISYCYNYKNQTGEWFNWLYLDSQTLIQLAHINGWKAEIIMENDHDQYLAKLTLV